MCSDGFRHARILTLAQRVIAPHHTLQFWEFADHAGSKIRLRQTRRAGCKRRIRAHSFRNQCGEFFQPRHALALRAKLGVEHHAIQLGQEAF